MTTLDLSSLLALAEAESFGPAWLQRNGKPRIPAALTGLSPLNKRNPRWAAEERAFLAENIGRMSDAQIAAALGRTAVGIKIKRTRWSLPAHSKRPGWLTGNSVAKILGSDIHAIMALADRNILPCQRIPGKRGIMAIRRVTLYRWAVNPAHWCYFRPENVTDAHLARLIELKRIRWGDEWWTVGQVCEWHGICHHAVNKAIAAGKLPAARWGNHYVLRSQAHAARFYPGKGHGHEIEWSDSCDAFIVLSSACGFGATWIAAKTHRHNHQTIWYRLQRLHSLGLMADLMQRHNLPVQYNPTTGQVFADWRAHTARFPALAAALALLTWQGGCLTSVRPLQKQEVLLVRSILARWMDWYNIPGPRRVALSWSRPVILSKFAQMLTAIEAHAGAGPL